MPVLVIAVVCFLIFQVIMLITIAAVHLERRQQVHEEVEATHHEAVGAEAKTI